MYSASILQRFAQDSAAKKLLLSCALWGPFGACTLTALLFCMRPELYLGIGPRGEGLFFIPFFLEAWLCYCEFVGMKRTGIVASQAKTPTGSEGHQAEEAGGPATDQADHEQVGQTLKTAAHCSGSVGGTDDSHKSRWEQSCDSDDAVDMRSIKVHMEDPVRHQRRPSRALSESSLASL
eukprot:TRINITY_DN22567_c0_g2_i1.p1 TRINITY_DN22567_c0_g2~~TRINITY_DN22567_c0_g2_i1.p1  ORF type:complete len:179 (-),score=12.24 TRINITY_DN22567_c0_g2_i1:293-829(-)